MVVPKRVLVITPVARMSEFLKRRVVTFVPQIIDYPAADYSIDETQNRRGFFLAIAQEVQMVRHDYISQDQKPARYSGFAQRSACHSFQTIKTEDWQSILRY
jgi:hypothetical protein